MPYQPPEVVVDDAFVSVAFERSSSSGKTVTERDVPGPGAQRSDRFTTGYRNLYKWVRLLLQYVVEFSQEKAGVGA